MRTPLNIDYRTLKVYFNIHASMTLIFKLYRPKFVIKSLATIILPFRKYAAMEYTEQFTVNTPNITRNLHKQLGLKVVFKKQSELTPSRKTNTHYKTYFYHFKIPT